MLTYPLGNGAGLGLIEPWHAEEFARSVADAREHLGPWIPFAHTVTDVEAARRFLQRFADQHASDTLHLYGVWRDGRLVGGLMFSMFDHHSGICRLGVWLSPEAERQGLMTRAARHLIDWAIRERGMSRVEWHTDPRNTRSRSVAQRLGLTFEGVRRSSHVVAGERQDEEVWAMLAHEWTTAAAEPVVPFFDATYGNFHTDVQAAVRERAFGEDIGQNGWLTAEEWRQYLGRAGLGPETDLLDVASGSGGPALYAAAELGCRVVGVDRHQDAVATARGVAEQRGVGDRVRFVEADAALRLPYDDASFDAITCIDAIHHFADRPAVLAEWRRLLRPGGHLIYTDPVVVTGMVSNEEFAARSSIGFFLFTPAGTNRQLLVHAGFKNIQCEDTTQHVQVVAGRWHAARMELRDQLVALEGGPAFDGQQRFLATTAALALQGRLSRHTLHATA